MPSAVFVYPRFVRCAPSRRQMTAFPRCLPSEVQAIPSFCPASMAPANFLFGKSLEECAFIDYNSIY